MNELQRMSTRVLASAVALVGCADPGPANSVGALSVDSGFVLMDDSVRLFYKTVGRGEHDIVIPVRFYLEGALRPLASPDRRLVFYDPRARGRSEAGDRSIVTLDRQVADLDVLRASLGIDSMTLIGWSGLGMETFVYAMRHPDRVRQLVQVAPVAARDEPHNARAYATRLAHTDTAGLRTLRERRAGGEVEADPAGHCRALNAITMPVNFADRSYADSVPDTCRFPNEYPDSLGPLFDALLGSFRGYDWRNAAAALPIRRLVIHGAEDAFPLEGSQEWVPPGSSARLLVIDRAGHFPFVERPDVFFPAIAAFLRGDWPPGAAVPP